MSVISVWLEDEMRRFFLLLAIGISIIGCDSGYHYDYIKDRTDEAARAEVERQGALIGKTYWIRCKGSCALMPGIDFLHYAKYTTVTSRTIKVLAVAATKRENAIVVYVVGDQGEKGWMDVDILKYESDHPIEDRSVGGGLKIGMSEEDVIRSDYGHPDSVRRWETEGAITEVWYYRYPEKKRVYLRNKKIYMIEG